MLERNISMKSTRIQLSALSLYIIQKTVKQKSLLGQTIFKFFIPKSLMKTKGMWS